MRGRNFIDWHEPGLTVGQVAERSGLAASAIRFCERQGLLTSDRTSGNQRRFRADVLCRASMSPGWYWMLFSRVRTIAASWSMPQVARLPRQE
jgi:hypothetical protein